MVLCVSVRDFLKIFLITLSFLGFDVRLIYYKPLELPKLQAGVANQSDNGSQKNIHESHHTHTVEGHVRWLNVAFSLR